MKFGFKYFHKPTPKKLRKISAFVQTVCVALSAGSMWQGRPVISCILLVGAGGANKFFNLFTDDETDITSNDGNTSTK